MADTITIEFVGDTAKLTRASSAGMKRVVSDVKDAEGDVGKSADRMVDKFEDAFDGIHARVGTKVGPGFASLGGKLGGKVLGGFAALGIGSVIGSQISESLNIDAGVDKLEARLGLTAKEAGRLGDLAGETYAGAWGESMEEVQGFYAETMRAFPKLTDAALQKVTESAATTADVWDQDFNEVVRAAQNLLVNGLAPDAQTAMDMVATALQNTKGPQDEVLMSLKEYSDHFAVLGLDGANIIGGLTSKWATNEYAIDKVGDAIKELGIRTLDGSETTKTGLEAIGLSVGEVEDAFAKGGETAGRMTKRIIEGILGIEDPAERARVGVALMGTPFEDLGKNAVPILKDVVKGQKDLTDTVEVGNKAYDNAKTKIESWRRQGLMKLTDFIGGTAIPAIEDFADEVEKVVKAKHIDRFVSHWVGELKNWVKQNDDYKERWRSRWQRSLGGWLQDTDDYKAKWAGRWDRFLGRWVQDTDDYKERWRSRWTRSLGGWLTDTDDYKERWRGRWNRTLGGWLESTDGYKDKWRSRWRNSLGGWLADTDDWKDKWLGRMRGAYNAVKNTVIDPLMRLWNRVSAPFGGPTIGGGGGGGSGGGSFNRGGRVPGSGEGDTVPAWLTPGEHVWTKEEVQAAGGHDVMFRLRKSVKARHRPFDPPTGGDPKFAAGGVVAAQRFAKAQHGEPYRWGGVGPYGYDCSGFMSAILNVLQGKSPYSRRFTTSTISATGGLKAGLGPKGGFSIGSYIGNPGHMAGTLGGVNVEAGGSPSLVKYGVGASGASHPRFNRDFHASGAGVIDFTKVIKEGVERILNRVESRFAGGFWERLAKNMATTARGGMLGKVNSFDQGGYLPPGLSMAYNGTGRPEPVGAFRPNINVRVFVGDEEVEKRVNVYIDRREDREDTRLRMGGGR